MGGRVMAGVKGSSGGKRTGSGPKRKAQLLLLHTMIDSYIGSADWASIVAALVKKAKLGDVQAFRELRTCRFGHLPEASPYIESAQEEKEGHLFELTNFVDTDLPDT